jgi:putative N6-adenine-specific DNA methylase
MWSRKQKFFRTNIATNMTSELIAKTFQGLEPLLAQELTELGAGDIQIGRRMVTFTGDKEMMYRANFCLRTAIRILKPIKYFKAKSADDVYAAVKEIDWTEYLSPQTTFAVDSVVFSPEFHHSKFVAYKVKDAIADQFRERTGSRPNVSVSNPDIQLHIHISDYDATLALDSSGESLHRRGYRQETVAAPLNEVLAAGIIMMTGWKGETDFLDPFCGSGTLCIEAALIARGIAPGIFRQSYAFEKWPDFDRDLFEQVYNDDSNEREFEHHIYGRDNDPKAVGIASRNVRAAGLSKDITIEDADFTKVPLKGQMENCPLIVTNPPYGERISSPDLLGLYKTIGQKLKREHTGGEAWVLSFREECFEQIGLKPSLKTPLYNGSLECELRKYVLFDGRLDEHRAAGGTVKTDEERREMAQKHRFKKHRDDFRRSFDDEERGEHREFRDRRGGGVRRGFRGDREEGDDSHRFNKFSKNDNYRGRREGFGGKGGKRDDRRGDYRAKGEDRAARQAARKRFFNSDNNNEED